MGILVCREEWEDKEWEGKEWEGKEWAWEEEWGGKEVLEVLVLTLKEDKRDPKTWDSQSFLDRNNRPNNSVAKEVMECRAEIKADQEERRLLLNTELHRTEVM